jgi:hypothetical protein
MLGLALIGLAIFSFSNHVAIGSFEFGYSLPPQVISIANIFRASGRMVWPIYYIVIFAIIFLIVRAHTPRIAAYLLGMALLIQVFDTHSGWSDVRKTFMVKPASEWAIPFVDPFGKALHLITRKFVGSCRKIYPHIGFLFLPLQVSIIYQRTPFTLGA